MSNENSSASEENRKESRQKTERISKNTDPFDEPYEKIIVNTVLVILLTGLFGFAVGAVWSIKDLFSETVWDTFKNAGIQFQLFWIGLILLGVFFLVLFLFVLYKRGIISIAEALFKDKPHKKVKEGEEYLPAKIITAGALISIFMIFIGLLIALIQWIVQGFEISAIGDVWGKFSELPGGARILIISIFILIFDGLIYGFIYVWMNGQSVLVNKIINYNKKIIDSNDFSKNEKIAAKITFAIIAVEICMIILGLIWTLIGAILGNIEFSNTYFGFQFAFYSFFSSFLFATLIGVMFLYKRGMNLIMLSLFIKLSPKDEEKDNTVAKIISIGVLSGIIFMVLGLVIWLVSLIIEAISGVDDADQNIFQALAQLSGGLAVFSYGLIALIFTLLMLVFSFFLHNGYYFTMDKILKIEQKIDEGLDDMKKSNSPKKTKS